MIEEKLKEKIKEIKKIKLVSAVYKKEDEICYLDFLTSDILSDDSQKEALLVCKEILKVNVALKFKKAIYDDDAVRYVVKNYLKNKYPNILELMDEKDLIIEKTSEDQVFLTFILLEDLKLLAEKNGFVKNLISDLSNHFFENFTVKFFEKKIENLDSIIDEMERKIELAKPFKKEENVIRMKVDCVEPLFGDIILTPPIALSCVKKPVEEVYICGKVQFFNQKTFKKKGKDGQVEEKPFYTFVLDDGTGKINCTYFPTKATISKMEKIVDDTKLVCFGKVELFNERLSFRPKDISLCLGFEAIQKKVEYKTCPEEYIKIYPEKYSNAKQLNLLGEEISELKTVAEYLKNNEIVVFDLETTGLYYERDEIIEIGACKIINGEITETFETLIKPEKPIPQEATKVNNITNEMVEDCPKLDEVIGDFYKFSEGTVLVAYNAGFDKGFIDYYGEKCLYKFKNKVVDAMVVAQQNLKGLRNYKLKTVLEKLNIVNEGAHRAVYDAIATAKAFIVLAENL